MDSDKEIVSVKDWDDLNRLFKDCGSAEKWVTLDITHLRDTEKTLAFIKAAGPHLAHLHLSDGTAEKMHLRIGQGELDLKESWPPFRLPITKASGPWSAISRKTMRKSLRQSWPRPKPCLFKDLFLPISQNGPAPTLWGKCPFSCACSLTISFPRARVQGCSRRFPADQLPAAAGAKWHRSRQPP